MTPTDLMAGMPVLFVMAAEAEYGPALRPRIPPLITGVGPVEGAEALTAALAGIPRPQDDLPVAHPAGGYSTIRRPSATD